MLGVECSSAFFFQSIVVLISRGICTLPLDIDSLVGVSNASSVGIEGKDFIGRYLKDNSIEIADF